MAGLENIGAQLREGNSGRDQEAAGVMYQLDLKYPIKSADGSMDFTPLFLNFAAQVGKLADPYAKLKMMEIFQARELLPLFRDGAGPIVAARIGAARDLGSAPPP